MEEEFGTCSEIMEDVIQEFTEKHAGKCKLNEEKFEELKESCSLVDGLMEYSEGDCDQFEIYTKTGEEIAVVLKYDCSAIYRCEGRSVLLELLPHVTRFAIAREGSDTLKVGMTFKGVWDPV